jgi:hypothetical protein
MRKKRQTKQKGRTQEADAEKIQEAKKTFL